MININSSFSANNNNQRITSIIKNNNQIIEMIYTNLFKNKRNDLDKLVQDHNTSLQSVIYSYREAHLNFHELKTLFLLYTRLSTRLMQLRQQNISNQLSKLNRLGSAINGKFTLKKTNTELKFEGSTNTFKEIYSLNGGETAKVLISLCDAWLDIQEYKVRKFEIEKDIFIDLTNKITQLIRSNLTLIKLYLKMQYIQICLNNIIDNPNTSPEKIDNLNNKMLKYINKYFDVQQEVLNTENDLLVATGKMPSRWLFNNSLYLLEKENPLLLSGQQIKINNINGKIAEIKKLYVLRREKVINGGDKNKDDVMKEYMYKTLKANLEENLNKKTAVNFLNNLFSLFQIDLSYRKNRSWLNNTEFSTAQKRNKWVGRISVSTKDVVDTVLNSVNVVLSRKQQIFEIQEKTRSFFTQSSNFLEDLFMNETKIHYLQENYDNYLTDLNLNNEKFINKLMEKDKIHRLILKKQIKMINIMIAKNEATKNQLQILFMERSLNEIYPNNTLNR